MSNESNEEPKKSRRNPYQCIDLEVIQCILRSDMVTSQNLLTTGACNTNYHIITESGKQYVFRHYARGCPRKDFHAINIVRELLPVPKFVEMGEKWALLEYIDGDPLTFDASALVDVGRCLGVLSSVKFDQMGDLNKHGTIEPFAFGGFMGFFEQELKKHEVAQWIPCELLARLHQFIDAHADVYREFDQHNALVHGDFNPGNILIAGKKVVGILDWEFAMSGTPRTDTGNLLRHFGLDAKEPLEKGMLGCGVPLERGWEVRSQMADLVSHIDFLSSGHSREFKLGCVDRIKALVNSIPSGGATDNTPSLA